MFVFELPIPGPVNDNIPFHPDCHSSRTTITHREASQQMSSEDDDEKLVTKPFKFVTGKQASTGLGCPES